MEKEIAKLAVETQELRDRVRDLERQVDHLLDPEVGIYPRIRQASDSLKVWAIATLTFLILNLLLLFLHTLTDGKLP